MHSLDAYTLAFVSALAALFMAITMAGIYLAGNRERAIYDWALAGLFFALGHLLGFTTLGLEPLLDQRLALTVANGFIALGHGALLLGVQHHLGRPRWTWAVISMMVIVVGGTWFLEPMHSNEVVRISVVSLLFIFINSYAAALLWRSDEETLQRYRRAVAYVLLGYSLFLAMRMGYLIYSNGFLDGVSRGFVLVPVFLSSVLFYLGLGVALSLVLFRRKEVHLRFLARHDALTGLHNRYSLEEIASRELARAQRGKHALSLVVLDLDHFKKINDQYGHAAGDRVLEKTSSRIRRAVREADMPFRMGGEEFLIILPECDGATARQVADRLRAEMSRNPVQHGNQQIGITASFGVASYEPVSDDWESLLRRADRALYRAKERGRDRVEIGEELTAGSSAV